VFIALNPSVNVGMATLLNFHAILGKGFRSAINSKKAAKVAKLGRRHSDHDQHGCLVDQFGFRQIIPVMA